MMCRRAYDTRFETRTHETHPPFSWTYTIYTHAPWRARKNIYERLIGILVHSNNCCAHYLTNKNHIGNKFFFFHLPPHHQVIVFTLTED